MEEVRLDVVVDFEVDMGLLTRRVEGADHDDLERFVCLLNELSDCDMRFIPHRPTHDCGSDWMQHALAVLDEDVDMAGELVDRADVIWELALSEFGTADEILSKEGWGMYRCCLCGHGPIGHDEVNEIIAGERACDECLATGDQAVFEEVEVPEREPVYVVVWIASGVIYELAAFADQEEARHRAVLIRRDASSEDDVEVRELSVKPAMQHVPGR